MDKIKIVRTSEIEMHEKAKETDTRFHRNLYRNVAKVYGKVNKAEFVFYIGQDYVYNPENDDKSRYVPILIGFKPKDQETEFDPYNQNSPVTKSFKEFEMVLGFHVDVEELLSYADVFFSELKEAEKRAQVEREKQMRAEAWDKSVLVNKFFPLLEKEGYSAKLNITKEEFVESNTSISILINEMATAKISTWSGRFEVYLKKDGESVHFESKSGKPEKWLEKVREVFSTFEFRVDIKEKAKIFAMETKEMIGDAVGYPVEEEKDRYSDQSIGFHTNTGTAADLIRIKLVEIWSREEARYNKAFEVVLPVIKDPTLVKKIHDLLRKNAKVTESF